MAFGIFPAAGNRDSSGGMGGSKSNDRTTGHVWLRADVVDVRDEEPQQAFSEAIR